MASAHSLMPRREDSPLIGHSAHGREAGFHSLVCVCVWGVAVAVENAFLRAMLIHAFLGPILVWKAFMGTIFVWKPTGIFVRSMIDPCTAFLGPMLV